MSTDRSKQRRVEPGKGDISFVDQMRRFHGQIEQALYAAEQACEKGSGSSVTEFGCDCVFGSPDGIHCNLTYLREIIGDPVKQHDPETEAAALAAAEQYQQDLPPAMPEGGTEGTR